MMIWKWKNNSREGVVIEEGREDIDESLVVTDPVVFIVDEYKSVLEE